MCRNCRPGLQTGKSYQWVNFSIHLRDEAGASGRTDMFSTDTDAVYVRVVEIEA